MGSKILNSVKTERFRASIKVYYNNMPIVNIQSMSGPSRPCQILRAGISVPVTCKEFPSADVTDKSKRRPAFKITVYLQILFSAIACQEDQSASGQLPTFGVSPHAELLSSKFLRKTKFRRKSVVNFPPETSSAAWWSCGDRWRATCIYPSRRNSWIALLACQP